MPITTQDFRKGIYILFHNEPHQIIDTEFVNPGKGSAFFRTESCGCSFPPAARPVVHPAALR